MANTTCGNLIRSEVMRGLRLDDVGEIESGASGAYAIDAPILFQYEPQVPDRDRFEQKDGNGDTCALFIGPPLAVDATNLTVNLCELDAEALEFFVGGSVITEGSYGTVGYLAPTDSTVNEFGVGLELWSIAWSGRQRKTKNGNAAHYRHVFPLTRWQQGQIQIQNGISVIPLTGIGEPNSGFGTGLASDPFPTDVGDAPYGWVLDDSAPSGECGYITVP